MKRDINFFSDQLKDAIVAKLSAQCEDLYAECLKTFQRENLKPLWDKDWISIVNILLFYLKRYFNIIFNLQVAGKQAGFHGIAELYQSLVCKANKSVGEEITRLEVTDSKY